MATTGKKPRRAAGRPAALQFKCVHCGALLRRGGKARQVFSFAAGFVLTIVLWETVLAGPWRAHFPFAALAGVVGALGGVFVHSVSRIFFGLEESSTVCAPCRRTKRRSFDRTFAVTLAGLFLPPFALAALVALFGR